MCSFHILAAEGSILGGGALFVLGGCSDALLCDCGPADRVGRAKGCCACCGLKVLWLISGDKSAFPVAEPPMKQ